MDPVSLGLWYVCALGAAAFGAGIPVRAAHAAAAILAFAAATVWVAPDALPTLSAVGAAAAAGGGIQLLRRGSPALCAVLAGALAGIWTGVLEAQGLSPLLSPAVALAVPAAAAVLAAREGFAPPRLRDEAYLILSVLGAVAAAAPVVADGWRAALNLNLQDAGTSPVALPAWTFALSAGAALSGGLYSLWSRR